MACVVVKDGHGDCYASRVYGECSTLAISKAAGYLAHNVLGCESEERLTVGVCAVNDPGLARLRGNVPYAENGVEWLYQTTARELPDSD